MLPSTETNFWKRIGSDFEDLASAGVVDVRFRDHVDAKMRMFAERQESSAQSTSHCSPENEAHSIDTRHKVNLVLETK